MILHDIPIRNVDITSPFWSRMQQFSRQKTIPAIVKAQKSLDHWYCLTWKEGHQTKPHPFWDSDIYKVVEAACYFLIKHPDDEMMAMVEEAVDMIRNAQHPDGYINSYYTVHGINKRWTNLRDMHELYCLGHLIEATVAYETLTGSGRLLAPVLKAIEHVDSVFGPEPGKKRGYPGHQEIEIGLLRLYELTGKQLLFKLAKYFILERGQTDENNEIYFDLEAKARGGDPYDHMGPECKAWYGEPRDYGYHQADCPLVKANEVKGHSVRAMYYYTAATDLVRLAGDEAKDVKTALDRLWRDMVDHKIYVTGGLGSVVQWEGFGASYCLGDTDRDGTCYAETCATFALINWCQRMLRLGLHGEYADIMEVALYNGFLGAVGLEGDSFYYRNVLRTFNGEPKDRSKWFGVACCPPNVAKLLGSIGSLIYSVNSEENLVAVHLYIGSECTVPGTNVIISQKTDMPWSGEVEIDVRGSTALALRIPSWAQQFTCSAQGDVKDGYLHLPPLADSKIKLNFPMKARRVYANPLTGKDEICIMRGPLVYCIEDIDNSDVDVDHIALVDAPLKEGLPKKIASVDDVIPIIAVGKQLANKKWTSLYGSTPWNYDSNVTEIHAVPYFLRANRGGKGGMRVWTKRLATSQGVVNGDP